MAYTYNMESRNRKLRAAIELSDTLTNALGADRVLKSVDQTIHAVNAKRGYNALSAYVESKRRDPRQKLTIESYGDHKEWFEKNHRIFDPTVFEYKPWHEIIDRNSACAFWL